MADNIELKRRTSRLEEAVRLLDKVLSLVPTQQQMPSSVRHERGYLFAGSSQNITETKDESGEIISRTVSIKQATLPLSGIPIEWKLITALRQDLAICLDQCNIEYPDTCNIGEEKRGEKTLLYETAWRCCMQGLRSRLQWELKEAEAASNAAGQAGLNESMVPTSGVQKDEPMLLIEGELHPLARTADDRKRLEQMEQPKIKLPTNPDIAEVWNTVQAVAAGTANVAEICRSIAEKRGCNPDSLRSSFNRWKRKNMG